MTLRTSVTISLAAGVAAFGPTVRELQTACAGVAPGRPKDDCTLKRMQDTNAKASLCFQHDSSESHFRTCTVEFCGRQSEVCSGPGGPSLCKHQCLEYGLSQFENLNAIQHVPGAKWEAEATTATPAVETTTAIPQQLVSLKSTRLHSQPHSAENLQPQAERGSQPQVHLKLHAQNHSASNLQPQAAKQPHKATPETAASVKSAPQKAASQKAAPHKATPQKSAEPALSLHHAKAAKAAKHQHSLTAPSADDLSAACSGVGAGQATDECSTTMMRDTNAKATECYSQNPTNEVAYRGCCSDFCSHSGEACTGHQGQFVCTRQCTEYAYGRYINLKALSSVPGARSQVATAAHHHATVNRSEAVATSLAQHKVALRGRRFMATPELDEVKTACAGVAPGIPKDACTLLRMRFTNGKARDCFSTTANNEKEYQSCCTEFCHTESDACTGNGGKSMCFAQCIQSSHPLYINLKALSGLPGALKDIDSATTNHTASISRRSLAHKSVQHTEHKVKLAANHTHSHVQPVHDVADGPSMHSYRSTRSLGSGIKA